MAKRKTRFDLFHEFVNAYTPSNKLAWRMPEGWMNSFRLLGSNEKAQLLDRIGLEVSRLKAKIEKLKNTH